MAKAKAVSVPEPTAPVPVPTVPVLKAEEPESKINMSEVAREAWTAVGLGAKPKAVKEWIKEHHNEPEVLAWIDTQTASSTISTTGSKMRQGDSPSTDAPKKHTPKPPTASTNDGDYVNAILTVRKLIAESDVETVRATVTEVAKLVATIGEANVNRLIDALTGELK